MAQWARLWGYNRNKSEIGSLPPSRAIKNTQKVTDMLETTYIYRKEESLVNSFGIYHFVHGRKFIDRFHGKGVVNITLQKIKMEIFSRAKAEDAILGRWAVPGRRQLGMK